VTAEPLTPEDLAVAVERPDDDARAAAREELSAQRRTGVLAEVAEWLAAVQGRAPAGPPQRPRLVVVSGEVPARTQQVAADTGVAVRHVPAPAGSDLPVDVADACSREEALAAFLSGASVADEEADAGVDLLLVALPDPELAVPVASLTGLLTRSDASQVTATGQPDTDWMVGCAATRDAMRRGRPVLADQVGLLGVVGGPSLALAAGLLLRSAGRRTPVLLDGPATAAVALLVARMSFRAPGWFLPGSLAPDPGHRIALERLALEPVLDLGLRGDDGVGALLAVPVLRAAVSG
jgi:nicotinate-nucleotide--dimethylbenzimidazole phosphoribosyltransferase